MISTFAMSRWLAAAVTAVVLSAGVAQAQVSCTLNADTNAPLVGGTVTTTARLGRSTPGTGFAPAIEVFVPPGLTLTQASTLGQSLTRQVVGTFSGTTTGTLVNPLTQESVTGPSGFQLVLVRLPFGGLPQGAGPQEVVLSWAVSTSAVLGTPLRPQVTCLFAYGNDALNNPGTDAPIRSDVRTTGTDQLGVDVTPSLARLHKRVSPSPTVTGPSFPVTYVLSLDVAAGRTITGGTLQDTLPPQFQVQSITPSAGGVVVSPSPLPTTPGGTVQVSFPTINGTAADADATVTVVGYVPRLAANNAEILSPACAGGSTATITNTASFTDGVSGGAPVTVGAASASLAARAEQLRESITNLTSGGSAFRPGEMGRVTLTVDASDYFALSGVSLAGQLGEGLRYTGNATVDGAPARPVISGDFRSLSFVLGSVPAGATRVVSYEFRVEETYSAVAGDFVRAGDVITTQHTLTSTAPSGCALTSTEADGGADGSVVIGAATLTKTLASINGVAVPAGTPVRPGDVVTWRITLVERSGDLSGATIVDYLPRPIFNAQQYGVAPAFPSAALRFGPGNSLPAGTSVSLAAGAPTADNSLTITVGAFDSDPTAEVRMVFDLDFTVSGEPREDGLGFTNLVYATLHGSGSSTVTAAASAAFGAGDPAVTLYAGPAQVSSTLGGTAKTTGISWNPANTGTLFSASTFSSTTVGNLPLAGVVTGSDGSDVITYKLIAENRGSTSAHEVTLSYVPPSWLTCTAAPVSVVNGVGTALAATNVLVAGGVGWRLTAPLPGFHATNGLNLAVVTFRCQQGNTGWVPGTAATNTARVTHFASTAGGANFVPGNYVPHERTNTVTPANFVLTKTRGTAIGTIRDIIDYSATLTIPEGQFTNVVVTDAFPTTMALATTTAPTLTMPAGVLASGSTVVVSGDGRTVTWQAPACEHPR